MRPPPESAIMTLGFLTVVEHSAGHIGGYLILNAQARPLEFHCTAPVRPSRAQEVLFGKTLRPYLYGERIAVTLTEKATAVPLLLVTDCWEVLGVRELLSLVTVCAPNGDENSPPAELSTHDFVLGAHRVYIHSLTRDDKSVVCQWWEQAGQGFDLNEPFERIREAIAEAQGSVKKVA